VMIFVIYLLTNVITYQFSLAIHHLTDSTELAAQKATGRQMIHVGRPPYRHMWQNAA